MIYTKLKVVVSFSYRPYRDGKKNEKYFQFSINSKFQIMESFLEFEIS